MATNSQTLDNNAAKAARVRTLNADVQQHSLEMQMSYDRYKAGKAARAASRSALAGLRISRAIPGGTVAPTDNSVISQDT